MKINETTIGVNGFPWHQPTRESERESFSLLLDARASSLRINVAIFEGPTTLCWNLTTNAETHVIHIPIDFVSIRILKN